MRFVSYVILVIALAGSVTAQDPSNIGKGITKTSRLIERDEDGFIKSIVYTEEHKLNVQQKVVEVHSETEQGEFVPVKRTTTRKDSEWGTMQIVEEPLTNGSDLSISYISTYVKDGKGGYVKTTHRFNEELNSLVIEKREIRMVTDDGDIVTTVEKRDEMGSLIEVSESITRQGEKDAFEELEDAQSRKRLIAPR